MSLTNGLNLQGGMLTEELNAPLLAADATVSKPYPNRAWSGGGGRLPYPIAAAGQRPVPMAPIIPLHPEGVPQPALQPQPQIILQMPAQGASPWLYAALGISVGITVGILIGLALRK